jgi:hypothetical protein
MPSKTLKQPPFYAQNQPLIHLHPFALKHHLSEPLNTPKFCPQNTLSLTPQNYALTLPLIFTFKHTLNTLEICLQGTPRPLQNKKKKQENLNQYNITSSKKK